MVAGSLSVLAFSTGQGDVRGKPGTRVLSVFPGPRSCDRRRPPGGVPDAVGGGGQRGAWGDPRALLGVEHALHQGNHGRGPFQHVRGVGSGLVATSSDFRRQAAPPFVPTQPRRGSPHEVARSASGPLARSAVGGHMSRLPEQTVAQWFTRYGLLGRSDDQLLEHVDRDASGSSAGGVRPVTSGFSTQTVSRSRRDRVSCVSRRPRRPVVSRGRTVEQRSNLGHRRTWEEAPSLTGKGL